MIEFGRSSAKLPICQMVIEKTVPDGSLRMQGSLCGPGYIPDIRASRNGVAIIPVTHYMLLLPEISTLCRASEKANGITPTKLSA